MPYLPTHPRSMKQRLTYGGVSLSALFRCVLLRSSRRGLHDRHILVSIVDWRPGAEVFVRVDVGVVARMSSWWGRAKALCGLRSILRALYNPLAYISHVTNVLFIRMPEVA
jgi:hypothetical protein